MAEHAEHTCSALSLRRGEPVMATASRVERWLLVEQPGAWGREALLESHLDPLVARALQSHGRRHGVRILLIRRTGSHSPDHGQPDVRRVYLGRVPAERAEEVVSDLEAGLIDLDLYRGRCCFVPLVQAAELAVRRRLDERRLDAIVLEDAQFERDGDQVRTRFRHPHGVTEAVIRRRRGPVERLTCAPSEGRPWSYDLIELHTHG